MYIYTFDWRNMFSIAGRWNMIFVKLFIYVMAILMYVSPAGMPMHATEADLPVLRAAISDDNSIILERILNEALLRSGYQMDARITGMLNSINDVNNKQAAILPSQTEGWEALYPNIVRVPVIVDYVEFTVYTRSNAGHAFSRWSDLAGQRVGYRLQNAFIANNIGRAQAGSLTVVDGHWDLWATLLDNKTDAVILPRISHFEHRTPPGIIKAGVIERQPTYTYVNRDYAHLIPLLKAAYEGMIADGSIELIRSGKGLSASKRIMLHINSYNTRNEWERSQMEHIRQSLETGDGVEYSSVDLNSGERHSQIRYNSIISDLIRADFALNYPHLVIASGDEALEFVLDNYYIQLPKAPILFFDVLGLDNALIYGYEEYVTGIAETLSFVETAKKMLSLFPETKRIFILNDYAVIRSDKMREEIQKGIYSSGMNTEFVFSKNAPFNDILEEIRAFGKDTLVLIGTYIADSDGVYYRESSVQKMVAAASVNPVFCLSTAYIGHGTLGGLLSGTDAQNDILVSMIKGIMNGTPIKELPIIYDSASFNQWFFDYGVAKKFNVDIGDLPDGHIIVNRAPRIWESNPLEFRLAITGVLLLMLIIFGLLVFSRMLAKQRAEAMAEAMAKSALLDDEYRASTERMQAILDAMPIGLTLFDENLTIIDCNDKVSKMLNAPLQRVVERFFEDYAPKYLPDGQPTLECAHAILRRVMDGEVVITEWTHLTADGEPFPCELTVSRVEFDGKFMGLAFAYDLRHIRKIEQELGRAMKINQAILDNMPVGVAIFNGTPPRVADINDELAKMFKAPKQRVIDRYFTDFAPALLPNGTSSYSDALNNMTRAIAGETVKTEWLHQTAEGVPVPVDLTLIRVKDEDDFIGLGFLYDLSDIKRLTGQLKEALEHATAASQAKTIFLSNMSHEMRTPLNTIMGMSSIGKSDTDTDRKNYAFEKIEEASAHLLGVINDVLDMSKIEAGKLELITTDFSFETVLKKAINAVALGMEKKRQEFFLKVDGSIPHVLAGDDQRLTQVIVNLLSNAMKYTLEGGTIRLNTRLAQKEDSAITIVVEINDTGIGITPEQQARIFNAFEQADKGTSRRFGGTGLGLSISKRIVEMMGGEISVTSEYGKGSTFSFSFNAALSKADSVSLLDPSVNWETVRVLVTDDAEDILAYFTDILKRYGASCDTAQSGADALERIESTGGYDIYFVDWKMPGMNGVELTRRIKGQSTERKNVVVMISSTDWSLIHDDARSAGADTFLMKPLFASDITDCMNALMGVRDADASKNKKIQANELTGCNILLAEDVEINREILMSRMKDTGVSIDCAENGLEAVRMFEENPSKYDMIFMDVQMPKMDGLDATRAIRRSGHTIPVIAMTANVFKEDIEMCLDAGMNDHVGKPFDISVVVEKIRKYRAKK